MHRSWASVLFLHCHFYNKTRLFGFIAFCFANSQETASKTLLDPTPVSPKKDNKHD
jgi:hypothetical protein